MKSSIWSRNIEFIRVWMVAREFKSPIDIKRNSKFRHFVFKLFFYVARFHPYLMKSQLQISLWKIQSAPEAVKKFVSSGDSSIAGFGDPVESSIIYNANLPFLFCMEKWGSELRVARPYLAFIYQISHIFFCSEQLGRGQLEDRTVYVFCVWAFFNLRVYNTLWWETCRQANSKNWFKFVQ